MNTRIIFVTGGVASALGKGIVASSLGRLLKARGLKVSMQKMDPYLNMDPGTMNPYQHGEVFVTADGAETDLDLGHYERFIDEPLSQLSTITTGRIMWDLFEKQRQGDFNGETIQIVPHVTNRIKQAIFDNINANQSDVNIVEIGGTVGDIEGQPYLEALRQFQWEVGRENCFFVHLTLVPYLEAAGEAKTKPTQHSVNTLQGMGIQPDIVVCRTSHSLSPEQKQKIASFCNLKLNHVLESPDAETIYEVPLILHAQGIDDIVVESFGIDAPAADLAEWQQIVANIKNPTGEVNIALVGKYIELHDAYLSIVESLTHAGAAYQKKVNIHWVQSEDVTTENMDKQFAAMDGILLPGGFGKRGIEGKILAAQFARTHKIPLLGICYGMHMVVIEFARNVLGWKDANTSEVDEQTAHPVIDLMADQNNITQMGGTMRLGQYPCALTPGTKTYAAYGEPEVMERHRHRYEFNNKYRQEFIDAGMIIAGVNPQRDLVEIVELKDHPWFVAGQFHPEFLSRPNRPHPLFAGFIDAALKQRQQKA